MIVAQLGPGTSLAGPAFDRPEAQVAPGGRVLVRLSGGMPPYVLVPSSSNFDVELDSERGLVSISGLRPGRGSIGVVDRNGAGTNLSVLVAPPAGSVPDTLTLTLAGPNLTPDFVNAQIAAALARSAQLQPGATLTAAPQNPDVRTLHPGDRAEQLEQVTLAGNGSFIDVSAQTRVDLRVENLPRLEPAELMFSDDPETLRAEDDGVLFRDALQPGGSTRLYLYHATDLPDRHVTLALRVLGSAPARVELLGAAAGPSGDYLATGHAATLAYLRARRAGESLIVEVAPNRPFLLPLGSQTLDRNDLVVGIFDLKVLSGGPLEVLCIASTGSADVASLLDGPRVAGDGHFRTGTYALDPAPLALNFQIGDPDPAPLTVGMNRVSALRAQRGLDGDYGVVQHLTISLANPSSAPAEAYLYEVPGGNAVTTTLLFDGEDEPVEVACAKTPGMRYLIRKFTLAPGERREAGADYMTDGASAYPIQMGLTGTAPPPPDACR